MAPFSAAAFLLLSQLFASCFWTNNSIKAVLMTNNILKHSRKEMTGFLLDADC
jgi:hypothetical protein